ncbi:MAG: hypothetical protein GY716_08585 [bacterium]|nr:hypothetical protein [bacterium]
MESPRVIDEPSGLGRPFRDPESETESDVPTGEQGEEIAQPEEDRESLLARVRDEGYREGLEEANAQLEIELQTVRQELGRSLEQLASVERSLTRRHEASLLGVAIEAASRIARQRIEQGDPVAKRAFREAMDELPLSGRLRAHVHPEDESCVAEAACAEIEAGRLELVSDPSVTRGGVVIESDVEKVDATLEVAEQRARTAALGGREHT